MTLITRLAALLARRTGIISRLQSQVQRLDTFLATVEQVETTATEAAERVGRQLFKRERIAPRGEPVGAAVQSPGRFQRAVAPILNALDVLFISGSGTFSVAELEQAEFTVYFDTERGYFAEMRLTPNSPPFYKSLTAPEAAQLRRELPPPALIAQLFTGDEPRDE